MQWSTCSRSRRWMRKSRPHESEREVVTSILGASRRKIAISALCIYHLHHCFSIQFIQQKNVISITIYATLRM